MVSDSLIVLSSHPCIGDDKGKRLGVVEEQVRIYRELVYVEYGESRSNETPSKLTANDSHDVRNVERRGEIVEDETVIIPSQRKEDLRILRFCLFQALWGATSCLNELDRDEEAFEYGKEGVTISRTLVEEDPLDFTPLLSGFLLSVASTLAYLRRYEEAIEYFEERVGLWRRLTKENPSEQLRGLAVSLFQTARCLAKLERHSEAFEHNKEAVELGRGLAEEDPSGKLSDLALFLSSASKCLAELARHEEEYEYSSEWVGSCEGSQKKIRANIFLVSLYPSSIQHDVLRSLDAMGRQ